VSGLIFKCADLYPPLGSSGGPCRIVDRILAERIRPDAKEMLIDLVEDDKDLSNQQADVIYDPVSERGPHPFSQFVLTPHAQYRMDLRGVMVKDLRSSLLRFMERVNEWKRTRDPRYADLLQSPKFEWEDPKTGLFFVFGLGGRDGVPSLITTYWKNKTDPSAPSQGCGSKTAGHSAPANELFGIQTVVSEKPAKGIEDPLGDSIYHPPGESPKSDRSRSAPQRTDNREDLENHTKGPPAFNTPGMPERGEAMRVRSPGTPGEEYGHPYKDNIAPRRTATDEAREIEAGQFPTYSERQHKQVGKAKLYYRKYYRKKKNLIKQRAKRRYRKVRNSPSFKRRRKLRNNPKYKNRFRRLPAGGSRSNADRARRDREKKAGEGLPLSFYHVFLGWGDLVGFDEDGLRIHLDGEEDCSLISLRSFVRGVVFESEENLELFFEELDEEYGSPDPEVVANRHIEAFYRETFTPGYNLDPGPGAQDLGAPSPHNPSLTYPDEEHRERAQSHKLEIREMDNAGGSAKVIPSGHDFANKEASASRVAKRLAELLGETSTDVLLRSKKITPKGKRFDQKNAMYTFSVPGQTSANTYVVRMKVERTGNAKKLGLMDLRVSCECEFWRWQGPEHWAKVGNYLYGGARGDLSKPNIMDPRSIHRVCKHVAACLEMVKNWELPPVR